MEVFSKAVGMIFKRPAILVTFGLIMFIVCLVNYYNPIYTLIFGFGTLGFRDILNSIVSFLSLITSFIDSPLALLKILFILAAAIIVVSALLSIGLSGVFNIINNETEGRQKSKGEFAAGLKRYYFRTVFVTFRVLFFSILFLLFVLVVSVPAIIITQAWITNKPGLFTSAILLDIITAFVVFFCIMFFSIYAMFWFPASINSIRKPFAAGKHTADASFWRLMGRFLLIDIVFSAYQYLMLYADRHLQAGSTGASAVSLLLFLITWVLNTVFFSFLAAYTFSAFKTIRIKMQAIEQYRVK